MARVTYVNGQYCLHHEAAVHVEDRGFQFADSVYEVAPVVTGRLCHLEQHLDRLERSLGALAIAWPVRRAVLALIMGRVADMNRVRDGVVYVQVSRGTAPRNHTFPAETPPTLVVGAWTSKGPSTEAVEKGIAVVTRSDQRWRRPDIKTVGLLPNLLARQSAKESGAAEAWLVDSGGFVTEATAANAFIVAADGALLTHPADGAILSGVTRANVIELARKAGIEVGERPFTVTEAMAAREAFVTGTTVTVLPVTRIDGLRVGEGHPGPITLHLRALYQELRKK
ncbi:D-amino-acid transaminase [Magnetospirillum aberrantis]|uniref:Probable branched-chain-amino-acid aminotransferase n=1 Tax=Magnetospirillum aberrantis SpK TaxID=908842 RepID=A0A7C9UYG9_9PROT|nr:D-amino-acid transaminase [Magnetospirillum aberrantis]NFV79895.1 D-amino-acid transaminase [Magnetospirillum aberrantis SpK]